MTRKDYIAIASAFAEAERRLDDGSIDAAIAIGTLALCVVEVGIVLQRDNPRFDMDRFKRAAHPRMTERLDAAMAASLGR